MPKLVVGADRRAISAEVTVAWVSQNAGSVRVWVLGAFDCQLGEANSAHRRAADHR